MTSPAGLRFILLAGVLSLLGLPEPAQGSFTLNTIWPDWSFTASSGLASTTSQQCRDAYSAEIDCDYTLIGIVASMRTVFHPTAADYDRTCTPACAAALDAYTANVMRACSQPGDLAKESTSNREGTPKAPVAAVGEVFRYKFAQMCAKDE